MFWAIICPLRYALNISQRVEATMWSITFIFRNISICSEIISVLFSGWGVLQLYLWGHDQKSQLGCIYFFVFWLRSVNKGQAEKIYPRKWLVHIREKRILPFSGILKSGSTSLYVPWNTCIVWTALDDFNMEWEDQSKSKCITRLKSPNRIRWWLSRLGMELNIFSLSLKLVA